MLILEVTIGVVAVGAAIFGGYSLGRKSEQQASGSLVEELRRQTEQLRGEEQMLRQTLLTSEATKSRLQTEASLIAAQLEQERAHIEQVKKDLSDHFKALSAENLQKSNEQFLELAKINFEKYEERSKGELSKRTESFSQLVEPVKESLKKFDEKLTDLEQKRAGAYQGLVEQVKSLQGSQENLRQEAKKLSMAMSSAKSRGNWGELQLKRVVEMAHMVEYCDFVQQTTINDSESQDLYRPDVIVNLPGGKKIAIDSKVPTTLYLESLEAQDETQRVEFLRSFADKIKDHVTQLSKKSYWDKIGPSPEFVVLFLPGDTFFSAVLDFHPELIEYAVEEKVLIATPTTLIALLKAVAYGWQQEDLSRNADEIKVLGQSLYERLQIMSNHLSDMGKGLRKTVECYNRTVGAFESRVLVSARKFGELGITQDTKDLEIVEQIEEAPREVSDA
jgi:DNA recombination protein RmuC